MEDSEGEGVWVSADVSCHILVCYSCKCLLCCERDQAAQYRCALLTRSVTCRNALLMNALSTPSHLPSRQQSSGRNASPAEIQAEEEQRSARQNMFNQQV